MILTAITPYGLFRAHLPRPQACSVSIDRRPYGRPAEKDVSTHGTEILPRR
jgi:hypothetical protein